MKAEFLPYYYPTNIALIDDSQSFLNTLMLSLSHSFLCRSFESPEEALGYLNSIYFDYKKDFQENSTSAHDTFLHRIGSYHLNRHREFSVVVIDYDMPCMDGIEFCKNLEDPCVQKILLTGKASLSTVLDAFNNNIIDFYLDKQTDDLLQVLSSKIADMQKAYFEAQLTTSHAGLMRKEESFFFDPALADFFDDICFSLNVKNYYYMMQKSQFFLQTDKGGRSLIILDQEKMNEHVQIIRDEDGPEIWVEKLESGQYVPNFDSHDGFYSSECQVSNNPILSATVIMGAKTYYCALVPLSQNDTFVFDNFKTFNSKVIH